MAENISHSESKELIQAKKSIDEYKLDEADQLIKHFEEKGVHTPYDVVLCHSLKCELLFWQGLFEDTVKLAEQTYKESLGLGKNILSVDILLTMAWTLLMQGQGQTEKAQDIINQGEEMLKALTLESVEEYKQRKANIAHLKGWAYEQNSKADEAIKQFEVSISLGKELDAKKEIAYSLVGLAHVFMRRKGEFERALKYLKQSLAYAEESGNKNVIAYCLYYIAQVHLVRGEIDRSIMFFEQSLRICTEINNNIMIARVLTSLGMSYGMKGELNRSIRSYEQSLEIFKEFNYKFYMTVVLNNLSENYRMKGDLERALENIEQSMGLNRELGTIRNLAFNHDSLIKILIEMGDHERAQNCLRDLEQLNSQLNDKLINLMYLFDKALLLKTSPRARNRVKAEELLRRILGRGSLDLELLINALLNLCELLLTELQITNEVEILEEIKLHITQLLDLSEKSHSFWILGETYLLKAKLALISLNLKEARKLLTQGQKIAEKYGLTLLAQKISNEHDELLKQLTVWENLKKIETSLTERMDLARLNEQIGRMTQKRVIDIPKLTDEEPVLLLIVSEGGTPLFSQSFIEDKPFEDHLLGGFLTAINSFIGELFSEGLDRASFGEHTLLMSSLSPFFMCYIFKGQSYSAKHRIKFFINEIQRNKDVWETFKKYYKMNQEIQLKDIPALESLIIDIFIDKMTIVNN
ncbi:MAG: tetratricopeptide repeat protein [Promethearchaeota archaeon]